MGSNSTELGVLLCLLPLAGGKSISEPWFPLLQNKELNSHLNFPPMLLKIDLPAGAALPAKEVHGTPLFAVSLIVCFLKAPFPISPVTYLL